MAIITIEKDHIKTTALIPSSLTEYQRDVVRYTLDAYSFLLPRGSFTYDQFADAIESYYDIANPRNKEVVSVLRLINKDR